MAVEIQATRRKPVIWKHNLLLTLTLMLLGVFAFSSVRAVQQETKLQESENPETILNTLAEMQKANNFLEKEKENLNSQFTSYTQEHDIQKLVDKQVEEMKMAAGVIAVKGPGLVVTLDDSPLPAREKRPYTNDDLIHDWYIRDTVTALWDGGAEAIAINGQRLTNSSEIICAGSTIMVNGQQIVPPFSISAIGNQQVMRGSLNLEILPVLHMFAEKSGIVVRVEGKNNLLLPAAGGEAPFRYTSLLDQNERGGNGEK